VLGILARRRAVMLTHWPVSAKRDRLILGGQVGLADRAALADDPYLAYVCRAGGLHAEVLRYGVTVTVKVAIDTASEALNALTTTVVVPTGKVLPEACE
jgi:hypothetical protein